MICLNVEALAEPQKLLSSQQFVLSHFQQEELAQSDTWATCQGAVMHTHTLILKEPDVNWK